MLYVITLTLRPTMYKHKASEQNRICVALMNKIFRKDQIKDQYHLSLVAELTNECNIHYHGIIELKDLKAKAKLCDRMREYNTTFGKKDISQLMNHAKWVEYINKAKDDTRNVIGTNPIIYDDHNVLSDKMYRYVEEQTECVRGESGVATETRPAPSERVRESTSSPDKAGDNRLTDGFIDLEDDMCNTTFSPLFEF